MNVKISLTLKGATSYVYTGILKLSNLHTRTLACFEKHYQYVKDYFACPDNKTFRFLASVYSCSHYNMSLRKEFEGEITNQAFWYPIYGNMQDWNYKNGGCLELTLEISGNKWPTANEVRHQLGRVFATFKYKTIFFSQVYHVYGDTVTPLV